MSKPVAIVLALVGWIAVVVTMNFHQIVPNASRAEIKPFIAPVWIFALITTVLAIKTYAAKPTPKA